ncbi:hypothetical protein [Aeromonas veronii]|uniref:hypothetical protein n=1 Tax=Aeromonas veronii TaxID=654 RepID=UPI00111662CD|nr:hypothetical protein [Aeromonas veronii]
MMRLIFCQRPVQGGYWKKSNQFDIGKQHGQIKRATSCEVALSKRLVLGEAELSMHLYDIKENCKSLSDYDVTDGVTLAPNDHAFLLQKGCA